MSKALIIAEKPSVAADIARALGGFVRHGDYFENDDYVLSSAVGHLVEIAAPEQYDVKRGKWSFTHLPVIPPHFDLKPIEKTHDRLKQLTKLIKRKDVTSLINACDAGREGELIFRLIVQYAKAKQPMQRLWLQSMTPNGYPTMPGYQPGQPSQAGYGQPSQPGYGVGTSTAYGAGYGQGYGQPAQVSAEQVADLESQYGAPSATNVDRGRMTYDDVIVRTAGMFAIILGVGAVVWRLATNPATMGYGYLAMLVGCIGALVLGLVNSFKREPSPVLIMAYAVFEGAMLGAFSGVMEFMYPGIVMQAMVATAATFIVMLCAYKFAGFRVSGRVARIFVIAMCGYLLFSVVNFGLMITGVSTDPWGLRGVEVFGIPLGLIVGLLAVVMASVSLAMDFEAIQRGVERGLPTKYAWSGAFGLVLTIVWLYVEFLRILAILRDN